MSNALTTSRSRSGLALWLCLWIPFTTSACVGRVPERLATAEEAFPASGRAAPPDDAPIDARKKSVFPAAFEDVFRAVEVSASQVQFNVEDVDHDMGVVLATRTIRNINPNNGIKSQITQQYHYGIWVEELGAESTRVQIVSKFQSECEYESAWAWTGYSLVTLGIAVPGALLSYPMQRKACSDASELQWADQEYDSLQEMSQFLTFVRNNLIAAGVM